MQTYHEPTDEAKVAEIAESMERDGWVERQACVHDRRKKRLRATAKAHAVWQRMAECAYRMRAKSTEGISPAELLQLRSICERIRANVDEVLPPAPPVDSSECITLTTDDETPPAVAPLPLT